MKRAKDLKKEIWGIMKANEIKYDPAIGGSPYDAVGVDGAEYHILHSIKAVNKNGMITIYNATSDNYTPIESVNDLKIVRAFILDKDFSFVDGLWAEREKKEQSYKALVALLDIQTTKNVQLLEKNYSYRELLSMINDGIERGVLRLETAQRANPNPDIALAIREIKEVQGK